MAFEQKDNTFTLFENDKKGNEKRPDYSGRGNFNGKEVKIAVWKRTGKTGVEYWSGTIEEIEKPVEVSTTTEKTIEEEVADGVPF